MSDIYFECIFQAGMLLKVSIKEKCLLIPQSNIEKKVLLQVRGIFAFASHFSHFSPGYSLIHKNTLLLGI